MANLISQMRSTLVASGHPMAMILSLSQREVLRLIEDTYPEGVCGYCESVVG